MLSILYLINKIIIGNTAELYKTLFLYQRSYEKSRNDQST